MSWGLKFGKGCCAGILRCHFTFGSEGAEVRVFARMGNIEFSLGAIVQEFHLEPRRGCKATGMQGRGLPARDRDAPYSCSDRR